MAQGQAWRRSLLLFTVIIAFSEKTVQEQVPDVICQSGQGSHMPDTMSARSEPLCPAPQRSQSPLHHRGTLPSYMQEQKLRPGESIDMPIFFYVDPEYATDPRLKHINALTLSYTFFKVSEDEVEAGEEGLPAAAPLPSGAPATRVTA